MAQKTKTFSKAEESSMTEGNSIPQKPPIFPELCLKPLTARSFKINRRVKTICPLSTTELCRVKIWLINLALNYRSKSNHSNIETIGRINESEIKIHF